MIRAILTIDDISSKNTPEIVDFLCEKGITAVMFARGENVERYYDEAVYAVQKGMIVGNHSCSHPAFSAITLEEGIKEIEKCEKVLNRLYLDSGVQRKYRPFRFPYGDKGGKKKEKLQQYFKNHGFHKVDDRHIPYPWWKENGLDRDVDTLWTFDFEEYRMHGDPGFTKESIWQKMHNASPETGAALFGENNWHILLLHAHDETEEMLPGYYRLFIDHLVENGVTFDEPQFI